MEAGDSARLAFWGSRFSQSSTVECFLQVGVAGVAGGGDDSSVPHSSLR